VDELEFEEQLNAFWGACDEWAQRRLQDVADPPAGLADVDGSVEESLSGMIAQAVQAHGFSFSPGLFDDLHHLLFELELRDLGLDTGPEIHRYRDNAQVALSVIDGTLTPDNAALVMMLNRSHHEKKGGSDDAVCPDCICGRAQP